MDVNNILAELRAERDRIDQAISALQAVSSTGRQRVARGTRAAASRRSHGRISTAARRKLSRLLKQRWAQGKMKPRPKVEHTKAPKAVRRMSQAARNRIAAAQRARWAKLKAQQSKKGAA